MIVLDINQRTSFKQGLPVNVITIITQYIWNAKLADIPVFLSHYVNTVLFPKPIFILKRQECAIFLPKSSIMYATLYYEMNQTVFV